MKRRLLRDHGMELDLSDKMLQILELSRDGAFSGDIAKRLKISNQSAEQQLENLYEMGHLTRLYTLEPRLKDYFERD